MENHRVSAELAGNTADFITAELQTSSRINIITNTVDTNTGSFIAAPVGVMCR